MSTATAVPDTMRAAVLLAAGEVEMQQLPVPTPAPDEVLIRVGSVGVCGSDVHYYKHGRIGPFVVDSPLILGHECGGTIVAVGADVDAARIGQRVAIEPQRPCRVCAQCSAGRYNLCPDMKFYATPPIDGSFCKYVTIQAPFAHPVPDNLSDDEVALLEPLSVGIAANRKGNVIPGSKVLIAGGGPIGVIALQTALAFGAAEVVVSDPVAERRDLALTFGATGVLDAITEPPAEGYFDAFLDCCGIPSAVVSGLGALRGAGAAVLVGTGSDEMKLPIPTIQNGELIVTGIFRYTDTWPAAIHLVASGKVDLKRLVTGHFTLEESAAALESTTTPGALKSVVRP
ncbi:alcohol dehydrogenase catalytic domain-containing protein [Nakamurella sp. YIM 132087]|uniref:Alcohol dehydrogenase catalytic domain-containing protein n=1 Tax=Nakamurella alba TaxID=2665158 RepID=A0A7K1FM57_9ACTN|nr:NAD(P)-dependent alcohol dehydrogenase [Nakamurella alba]MTD15237.1 alcohol dehydrogenase catalytic domain-containing protein [Nakamurella alba]